MARNSKVFEFEWSLDDDQTFDGDFEEDRIAFENGEFEIYRLIMLIDGKVADALGKIWISTDRKGPEQMKQFEQEMLAQLVG